MTLGEIKKCPGCGGPMYALLEYHDSCKPEQGTPLEPGSPTPLDLSDPLIRDMADGDHLPQEFWVSGAPRVFQFVICQMCGAPWPCETRVELREKYDRA